MALVVTDVDDYTYAVVSALAIAMVAWLASLLVLYGLSVAGVTAFDAVGVPGV